MAFGGDAGAIWHALQAVDGWTCVNVLPATAAPLSALMGRELSAPVRTQDDIYHTLEGPAPCIVREEGPPVRPGRRDRLYYRWYAKEFEGVMQLLRDLTAGRFKDGAVARVLAMEFWSRGEAPTFEEFARSWTKAKAEEHRLLTPEYAYLTDLKHHGAASDWKAVRTAKAKSALKTLARIAPV